MSKRGHQHPEVSLGLSRGIGDSHLQEGVYDL